MTKRARLSPSSPPALRDESSTFRAQSVLEKHALEAGSPPSALPGLHRHTKARHGGATAHGHYRLDILFPAARPKPFVPTPVPSTRRRVSRLEARSRRSPCERSVNRPPCFRHLLPSVFVSAYRSPFPLPTKTLSSTTIGDWTNPPSRNRHCWSPDSASTPYTWPSWLPR